MFYTFLQSPIGPLLLAGSETALEFIGFPEGKGKIEPGPEWIKTEDVFKSAIGQLTEYFAGDRQVFDLALAPSGTAFQLEVLQALQHIPFGQTCSYGDIASTIKRPKAVRAVGAANGRNPLPIVIPCHRVIGSNGSLTGFGGGLSAKAWLLQHEKKVLGVAPGGGQAALF
ncbi:MAG: methylated-DNA--[protein]-cysteine S-methyltransferase [Pseudomonadales bacterium]